MQKHLRRNKKALSSLGLILLLLISAIIGGLISYLWVMGYYIGLNEKVPEENVLTITNLDFNPQNATAFNVTVLNPSFSPDENIQVKRITISAEGSDQLNQIDVTTPTLPINVSRGATQTFVCGEEWTQYVNRTIVVSVFVENGTGSTSSIKLPYVDLLLENGDTAFNPFLGVSNLTLTFENPPESVTYLNITGASLRVTPPTANFTTLMEPRLPFALIPNSSQTFSCAYNWLNESRLGGSYSLDVETYQGYRFTFPVSIPQLAFSVQEVNFDPGDTTHFNVTVKNDVSTYLNVSKIEARLGNNIFDVTPSLSSSTNGILGNSTITFRCSWNWAAYRNQNTIVTVYTRQGIQTSGQQTTPQSVSLSIGEVVFPDTQHFLIAVNNSRYSIKTANITVIQVELDNGTQTTITTNPSLPYLLSIGNTTMFACSWDWSSYLDRSVNILIYIDNQIFATFRATNTPADASNYHVYLSVSWANFTAVDTTNFFANITNSASSDRNANITRITVLLENGTEIDATIASQIVAIDSTATFTCGWDWTTYRSKNVVIRVYTDEGLRAIYVTKTTP
jgi:hypothetical protein